ncbi:MAG: T9SS type A sorting domain-containing protein, partial [Bacteroidaceae bacterium]|nr:T9SS type A sorting domain-containing protein [Bacteroidaceae bacterium]
DDGGRRAIPYSGGAYIFFSAEAPTGVEDVRREGDLSLVYLAESQQIAVCGGADAASRIRLISPQGSVLRVANHSRTVSTEGLPSGILIATAACGGKTITRKFIIK